VVGAFRAVVVPPFTGSSVSLSKSFTISAPKKKRAAKKVEKTDPPKKKRSKKRTRRRRKKIRRSTKNRVEL
jgi:hypothetical protein